MKTHPNSRQYTILVIFYCYFVIHMYKFNQVYPSRVSNYTYNYRLSIYFIFRVFSIELDWVGPWLHSTLADLKGMWGAAWWTNVKVLICACSSKTVRLKAAEEDYSTKESNIPQPNQQIQGKSMLYMTCTVTLNSHTHRGHKWLSYILEILTSSWQIFTLSHAVYLSSTRRIM